MITILLFDLATWHAYAKLRLHTDTTLNNFRILTSALGRSVRIFVKEVCSQYKTTELPHKMATRGRRESALAGKKVTKKTTKKVTKKSDTGMPGMSQKRLKSTPKKLNLLTYKYNMLGEYPDQIASFGTTDNGSIQMVRVLS